MKTKFALSIVALFGLVWLTACSSADPTPLPSDPQEPEDLTIESVELLQAESWPVQIRMELAGTLPSACYSLDYEVILPGAGGVIEVEAHAKLEENSGCEQQAEPFRQGIGLGSYREGDFEVLLNGEPVGKLRLGSESKTPGSTNDGGMTRGPVFIDEVELVILESFPVQIELVIRGALPTPMRIARVVGGRSGRSRSDPGRSIFAPGSGDRLHSGSARDGRASPHWVVFGGLLQRLA